MLDNLKQTIAHVQGKFLVYQRSNTKGEVDLDAPVNEEKVIQKLILNSSVNI